MNSSLVMNNSTVLAQYAFQRQYISLLVDDIPDERLCEQPGAVVNHPAWQLGHMANSANNFLVILGGESKIDPSWKPMFGKDSIPKSDRNAYPKQAELIRVLDDRRTALAQMVAETSDDELSRPNPLPKLVGMLPTMGHLVLFGLVFHESTHLGQLTSWRKAAGMVQAISKLGE
jgi:uncharacterized damage-inducible protein DinB